MAQRIVKPRLKIKLSDGTSTYTKNATKRKISAMISRLQDKSATISGSAIVEYGKGFNSSFDFDGEEDLLHKLLPCIEKELLDGFHMVEAR